MKFHTINLIFGSACLTILTGCTLAPAYERPAVTIPDSLMATGQQADDAGSLDRWWEQFNDPELNRFVEKALATNSDLAIAASRIQEARALMGQANAELFPTLSGQAGASRRDAPDTEVQPGMADPGNSFSVSGLLSYELDLFGRIRNSKAAARERLLSTQYAYYAIRNAVIAQIASLYYQAMAIEEQIELAEQTIKTREEALSVQQRRYDSGYITQLLLQQTRAELADARVNLPYLKELSHSLRISLHLVAGDDPESYWNEKSISPEGSSLPDVPHAHAAVIPASLMERRPDILAAEAELRAAFRQIGISKAQRWPSLSLSALLGTKSEDLDLLFTGPAATWSVAGALAGPVYDFGRSGNRVRISEAQRDQAGWNYRQVVLRAMGEVNLTLASIEYAQELVATRRDQCAAFDKTLELARLQYNEGYSDYLELLDAERHLFGAKLALVEARYGRILAWIQFCKALGGGWDQTVAHIETPVYGDVVR